MSEFIVFTDPHYQRNSSKSILLKNGRTSWLDTQINLTHRIFKYARENGINTIIVNGDIFHEKNLINTPIYNEVWDLYKQYSGDFKIFFNTGNHDFLNLSRVSALYPFTSLLDVVQVPTNITLGNDLVRIVPFGMLSSTSLQLPEGTYEHCILCTHEDIQGFKYSSGQNIETSTQIESFKGWDTVFNGHIHTPQNIKNVVNIGSMMIQDWGESRDSKRFIHYKDGKIIDLHLESPDFIEIPNMEEVELEKMAQDNYNYYRIHISPEQLSNSIFNKFNVFPKVDKKRKRESRMQENISFEEKVNTYVSLQDTELNKTKLIDVALELEQEAGKVQQDELSVGKFTLKAVYAENFRSYKELKLNDIDKYGLTLIQGKNGFGKSSLKLLIEYLLTDSTSEDISLDELSFNKEGNCKMEGTFIREEDAAEIVITKYREHKTHKDKTILSINGESDIYTTSDRRETQKNIFQVFGITKEILNISNIFSQASLSFPKAKDTDRKKVVYDALNLHKYTPLQKRAKEQVESLNSELDKLKIDLDKDETLSSSLVEDIVELKNSEIDFSETRLKAVEGIKELIQGNEVVIKEKQAQLNINKLELTNLNKTIPDNIDVDLQTTKEKRDIILKEIKEHRESLQGLNNIDYQIEVNKGFIQKEEESISRSKDLLQVEQDKYKDIVIEDSIKEIDNRLQTDNNSLSEYKTKKYTLEQELNKISCTTCPILNISCNALEKECFNLNQKYSGQIKELADKIADAEYKVIFLQKSKKRINILIESKKELKDNITRLKTNIETATTAIVSFNEEIQRLQKIKDDSSISEIKGILKEKELELEEYNRNIISLEEFLKAKQDLELKRAKIENMEASIDTLLAQNISYKKTISEKEQEENPYTTMISKKEEQVRTLKHKKKDVKSQIHTYTDLLGYYTFWVTGFSNQGLPNLEISSFLEMLEDKTNQLLSFMTKDLSVKIDDQSFTKKGESREKISYELFSPTKKITTFSSYSGGQKQRVLLADMLSFKELVGKFNFLFLDEVLELSLDNNGKEEILKLLVENFKHDPVFVISHDSEIKNSFDSVIEVNYENGVSRIGKRLIGKT